MSSQEESRGNDRAQEEKKPEGATSAQGADKPKKKAKAAKKPDYRIPAGHKWAGAWKIWATVGAVGLIGSSVGYLNDPRRFAYSYLFAFMCALTCGFGALFFVIFERFTMSYWSVSVRRVAEFFVSGVRVLPVLFLPVILSFGILFPYLHGDFGEPKGEAAPAEHASLDLVTPAFAQEHVRPGREPGGHDVGPGGHHHGGTLGHGRHDGIGEPMVASHGGKDPLEAGEEEAMAKKAPYLAPGFFYGRMVAYFAIWFFLATSFFRYSTAQDSTKDPQFTLKAQRLAPVATVLMGLSLTFAAFDWVMSLEPSWFSTIFGVTIFAGSIVTIYATLTVVAMALKDDGLLGEAVTVEHFHDLGKLLFGFLVFWAYVSFAQFMLIWYAALPEETTFYHHRWDVGPWSTVSLAIVIAHFVVPFFFLLSRNVKRRLSMLRIGAVWLLFMHVVEMYWLVMPNYNGGEVSLSWIDFACLAGVVGTYLAVVFFTMARYPLIPVGDPRLPRSLAFENA